MARKTDNLKIRIAPVQRKALRDEAAKRQISTSQLVREGIAAVTGCGDPLRKGYWRSPDRRKRPVT